MSHTNISKVDRVLSVPSIFGVTVGQTNLAYLIQLLNLGNYLRDVPFSWDIATRPNTTYFAPNSVTALANIPPNGNKSTYDSLLEYHCVNALVYSSDFVNGTEFPTFNGSKMIIRTDSKGQVYANNARIIGTNYLVANGVMHVLDE
jgi:uncharacterized surface protein with fasciclin (FAS1) repeats